MLESKIQIAIIGMGRAGRFHLASLQQLTAFELTHVVDPNLSMDEDILASNHLQLASLEEVLGDEQISTVVVSAPTGFHYDIISRSLLSGKHVFAEKPLGKSLDEINSCYDLAAEHGLVMHLGFQRRLDSHFIKLKQEVAHIDPIRIHKASSRDNPRPSIEYLSISGNIFHDMLIHDFDMLSFLYGPIIPSTVFAQGYTYDSAIRDIPDFDTVLVQIQYPDGLLCSIDTSRISAYGYDQRIELFGQRGMAIAENVAESTVRLYTPEGLQQDKIQYSFPQRYQDSYLREMKQFAQGIQLGRQFNVSRRACILAHLIADAAHKAATTKEVIDFQKLYGHLIPE